MIGWDMYFPFVLNGVRSGRNFIVSFELEHFGFEFDPQIPRDVGLCDEVREGDVMALDGVDQSVRRVVDNPPSDGWGRFISHRYNTVYCKIIEES